jgi:YHS domain-containing protein
VLKDRRAGEAGWYRRNWKTVFAVWGILLGLLGLVAAMGWTLIRLTRPRPHVHVHTNLKVVEPSDEYPLRTCVVSGKPLPAPSRRAAVLYMGTEVQFCCGNCIPKFERNPEEYMKALR